jgi:outer membrane protein insertion porin family
MRLSLTRALWSDFFIGSIAYTIEDVDISLNSPFNNPTFQNEPLNPPGAIDPNSGEARVPQDIINQTSDHLFNRFATTLAYDTRNSVQLPNHGQRTELDTELSVGDQTFYKVEVKSQWYFPGLFKGHVIEAVGRASVADGISGGDVPFYDRFYLGGLDSLRGFKYRNVSPREAYNSLYPYVVNEPIGGDSLLFGSLEYSLPIMEKDNGLGVRVAAFYDAGMIGEKPYSFSGDNFDDDWGLGLRLNIPRLGPLRLDYGIPLSHDKYNSGAGQFQFSVGYTRPF